MAIGKYIGVNGVARKVVQPYIGVANVARKETKEYIGVNGVARLCYQSGIAWLKYNCDYEDNDSYEIVAVGHGTIHYDNDESYNVFTDIFIDDSGQLVCTGSTIRSGDDLDGYYDGYDYLSLVEVKVDRTLYNYTHYSVRTIEGDSYWKLGSLVGTVNAPDGAYPDSDKGYVHWSDFEEDGLTYTVMRDPSTNDLYAYVQK